MSIDSFAPSTFTFVNKAREIMGQCPTGAAFSNQTLCLHPTLFLRIKDIMNLCLTKHTQFEHCEETTGEDITTGRYSLVTCSPFDDNSSRNVLSFSATPSRLSLEISWISDTIGAEPLEGITCTRGEKESHECLGKGSLASYNLKWESDNSCKETILNQRTANCSKNLLLFDSLLNPKVPKKNVAPSNAPKPSPKETTQATPGVNTDQTTQTDADAKPQDPTQTDEGWSTGARLAGVGVGVLGLGLYAKHRANQSELQKANEIQSKNLVSQKGSRR